MDQSKTAPNGASSFLRNRWHLFALAGIALLSFGLNFYAISTVGFGNAYYAAAIRSMTQSFHNFFFVAFDPAGMVSVDKPPLGLWIQALFVLVFGYHGWAMLLPQALAGTGACLMMYALIARHFGRPAGLTASLVFALTPAVVVVSRNNTMDMQLIFVLLVAAWFLFRSIETGKWRFLFLAALFVGLGFNIKMLEAYMILPAVAVVYLIFAREKFGKRILAGLISVAIVGAVSFAWVAAVDLTPAASRPYVGSSSNNTVTELIFGHNGAERIYGQGGGGGFGGNQPGGSFGGRRGGFSGGQGNAPGTPGQDGQNGDGGQAGAAGATNMTGGTNGAPQTPNGAVPDGQGGNAPPQQPGQDGSNQNDGAGGRMQRGGNNGFGGGAAGDDIGTAGPLRLWSSGIYGQASWLIVLALFCIAASLQKISFKKPALRHGVLLFWILWLATMVIFFSFAGFFHRYYTCMLAPGIAGCVGIGFPGMVRAFRSRQGWRQWLLPVSVAATFAVEIVYVWSYSALRAWLVPAMSAVFAAAVIGMAVYYFGRRRAALFAATGLSLLALLAAPFYWSLTVVLYPPKNVTLPYAGPELAEDTQVRGMISNQTPLNGEDTSLNSLQEYLVAHYRKGSYLVVAQRANDVAQFIVETGLPAVAYGGFLGTDSALSLDRLKKLVKEGKVTYFLASGQQGFGGGSSDLISYVEENATLIDPSEYGGTSSGESSGSLYLFGS